MSVRRIVMFLGCLAFLLPAGVGAQTASAQPAPATAAEAIDTTNYRIGPGDSLQIFVWKNPDLSVEVPVRPDGKITTPLVQDVQAQGKTPTQLSGDLREALSKFIQEPVVTVVVRSFAAPANASSIRVIGAAVTPKTVPYRAGLTALDVMIEVGGLSTFASGNRAQLIRLEGGRYTSYPLRLADLLKGGNLRANIELMPGDIIRVPQRGF